MESQMYLQGNLVLDPVQRVTANGLKVTRFRMASSGRRFDRSSGEWVSTDPVYMSVACWRQLGDNVMQTLRKGDTVVVVGRLTYREYDDPNGAGRRSAYEVDALSVGPDLSRYVAMLSRPVRDLPETSVPAQEQPGEAEPTQSQPAATASVAESAAA
jgi:single-strand DNA-binding protein